MQTQAGGAPPDRLSRVGGAVAAVVFIAGAMLRLNHLITPAASIGIQLAALLLALGTWRLDRLRSTSTLLLAWWIGISAFDLSRALEADQPVLLALLVGAAALAVRVLISHARR
ncbi:hypothetical protein GCM10010844_32370 [Deinococcus radiotolerans]|uniref:Uncharacterized protein n=2 Tax=Deinococcus radiotolerans TaxID=1309407 RepID=A0ABQ2FNE6_9DEIO|nr:hypothetical protein GCM10010844_32370 [Deinococcus radiotolerans]